MRLPTPKACRVRGCHSITTDRQVTSNYIKVKVGDNTSPVNLDISVDMGRSGKSNDGLQNTAVYY